MNEVVEITSGGEGQESLVASVAAAMVIAYVGQGRVIEVAGSSRTVIAPPSAFGVLDTTMAALMVAGSTSTVMGAGGHYAVSTGRIVVKDPGVAAGRCNLGLELDFDGHNSTLVLSNTHLGPMAAGNSPAGHISVGNNPAGNDSAGHSSDAVVLAGICCLICYSPSTLI